MFNKHQSLIQDYARQSPANMTAVIQFVILTIRVPLHRVAGDIEIAAPQDEQSRSVLWGHKWEAYERARLDAETTYSYLEYINYQDLSAHDKCAAMIEYLADQPGLGLAKAGFVTQLCYGLGGCLDTHNLKRFGYKETTFKEFKSLKRTKTRRAKLAQYLKACESAGGCEKLWDGWCEYVAKNQPENYDNADHVSRLHSDAFNL